ncbi:MAG: hypothetical protein JRJ45_07125 [Deltaproteobacteria bacterium]|nr:hypothetical protein [Deltaproteobacteria bacterium]
MIALFINFRFSRLKVASHITVKFIKPPFRCQAVFGSLFLPDRSLQGGNSLLHVLYFCLEDLFFTDHVLVVFLQRGNRVKNVFYLCLEIFVTDISRGKSFCHLMEHCFEPKCYILGVHRFDLLTLSHHLMKTTSLKERLTRMFVNLSLFVTLFGDKCINITQLILRNCKHLWRDFFCSPFFCFIDQLANLYKDAFNCSQLEPVKSSDDFSPILQGPRQIVFLNRFCKLEELFIRFSIILFKVAGTRSLSTLTSFDDTGQCSFYSFTRVFGTLELRPSIVDLL